MTTTEDLYQQANETYVEYTRRAALASLERAGLRAVVDLVIAARDDRQPWEVLREARDILTRDGRTTGESWLTTVAYRLEVEYRAEQEKKAAEDEREKLIEQAARLTVRGVGKRWESITESGRRDARGIAVVLVDAGWRPAPESDGGAA